MRNFLSGRRVRERRETETFCGSVSTRRSGFKKPRRRKRFAVSTRTPRWIARTNRLERYGQASGASRFTRDESARRRSPRRTPSRPCVHRHDGRVLDLPRRRGGARSDVRVEDHRLCVRQGASRRARDGRSRPPRAAILHSCITSRELTRKPNASDARRGARGGRLFFRRAAHRASPETWRRPRRRVASSTREARHPAARPADRDARTPGNYHPPGREPPDENITPREWHCGERRPSGFVTACFFRDFAVSRRPRRRG